MYKLEILDNGLKVTTESMRHMESVSIGIWVRAGGRYENKANNGISHFLEHLLFKGTKNRDMMKIKQEIEGRGGSFNGFTSEEQTCFLVKVLSKDAELGLDILSDMMLNPKLAEEEVAKEKGVIAEEINMYKDMPAHYVHEMLAQTMWPDSPLGFPLAGTVDTVRAIDRRQIAEYKEDYYNPKNMLVASAGRIGKQELVRMSKKYFRDAVPRKESKYERVLISQKEAVVNLLTKETEQTHIAIGLHAFDRFHPDRFALSMLNIILGANMSSRLFHNIRDEMALCYEISSSVKKHEDCGALLISAGVDHKKAVKCLAMIMKELAVMKHESVREDELKRAKEYYKGQLLFALEDTMTHMLWLGEKMISGEKDFDVAGILADIDKVSSEDVMRVANDIFIDRNINLAAISTIDTDKFIKEELTIR